MRWLWRRRSDRSAHEDREDHVLSSEIPKRHGDALPENGKEAGSPILDAGFFAHTSERRRSVDQVPRATLDLLLRMGLR